MRSFGPDNLIGITRCGSPSKRKLEQKRQRNLQKKIPRLSDEEFPLFNAAYNTRTAATLSHRSTQCARIGLEENSSFHRQSPSNIRSPVVGGCVYYDRIASYQRGMFLSGVKRSTRPRPLLPVSARR